MEKFIGVMRGELTSGPWAEKTYELEIAQTGRESDFYIDGDLTQIEGFHAHLHCRNPNVLTIKTRNPSGVIIESEANVRSAEMNIQGIKFTFYTQGLWQNLTFNDGDLQATEFDLFAERGGKSYAVFKFDLFSVT